MLLLPKFNVSSYARPARVRLVLGNALLALGPVALVIFTAIGTSDGKSECRYPCSAIHVARHRRP